ncbi:hypothetical protein [Paenibacillus silvisoli]|uniref:hypothetical protein n=1 Tax=Paenibacillus silvisoli TaxID=3110539 RepID=UPI00280559CB|nr:hypothetical protein [Paenibacillus silvisoli]
MSRRKTFWLLIVLQIVYILFIAVWLFASAMSVMGMNDASIFNEGATWAFIAYLLSYPLGLVAAIVVGWFCFVRKKYKGALIWNAYPLLWILSLAAIFTYAEFA